MSLVSKGEIKSILLYGPDKGEISDIIIIIARQLKLRINSVDYKDINNSSLYSIANSSSLFSQRELIKIQNVTNSIAEEAKQILIGNLQNFLVFIADELTTSSGIRKLFELEKNLAVLPCYVHDLRESLVVAKNEFDKYKKNINSNCLKLFCQIVGGLKNNIKNEVQKLCNYTNSKIIVEDDIMAISFSEEDINADLMCFGYVTQNQKIYLQEIDKLLNNSIEPIWIIRALGRYLLNILKVKNSPIDIELAIKTLNPPIFFKQIPNFKQAVNSIDLISIRDKLEILLSAEIAIKQGNPSGVILDQIFINHNSL
jgi:DNA polymerase-3 subunit delta